MAKTLSTIRSQVRSFLDESTASDWSDTELNRLINVYYMRCRAAVIDVYEDYYMTTALVNSVASQEEYGSSDGVPTNIYKLRRVELNYDVSSTTSVPSRCMPIQNFDAVRRDLGFANAGVGLKVLYNANYYTYGFGSNFKIGFIPIPNKAGVSAIKLWYVADGTEMTSDSDTIDIPYADSNWLTIAYGATAEALAFGQQASTESARFEMKYDKSIAQMGQYLEDRIAEETKSIIDVGDGEFFTN